MFTVNSRHKPRQSRGTDGCKFEPFSLKKVMDELGFHYKAVHNWNTVPTLITSVIDLNCVRKAQ